MWPPARRNEWPPALARPARPASRFLSSHTLRRCIMQVDDESTRRAPDGARPGRAHILSRMAVGPCESPQSGRTADGRSRPGATSPQGSQRRALGHAGSEGTRSGRAGEPAFAALGDPACFACLHYVLRVRVLCARCGLCLSYGSAHCRGVCASCKLAALDASVHILVYRHY